MMNNKSAMPQRDTQDLKHVLARRVALLRMDEQNDLLRKECIDLALTARAFDDAAALAHEALSNHGTDIGLRLRLCNALIGKREFNAAMAELEPLLETDARSAARRNLGLCHFMLGQYDEARRHLELCYENGDRDAGTLRLLISALHHLGEIDRAVKVANQNGSAATEDGTTAGVYALLYLDADLTNEASRFAGLALRANPDSVDGLTVLGTLQGLELDVAGACRTHQRVLELAPDNGRAWIGLGTMSLLNQDFAKAREQLQHGLKLMPGHVGSWLVLGWADLVTGDLGAAESTFRRVLEIDRNFAEVHGALASIAAIRGRTAEARHSIDVALKLDPACMSAKYAEAVLTEAAGDPEAARKLIAKTISGLGARSNKRVANIIESVSGGAGRGERGN